MNEARQIGQADLFQKFKDGDEDALLMLLEAERPYLFDYLLLMTGQDERAQSTLDEVSNVISADADRFETDRELLSKLYVTARNFCGDIWNGEVHQLQNIAVEDMPAIAGLSPEQLIKIDHALKKLVGPDREIMCLYFRAGFSTDELAGMFKVDASLVQQRMDETIAVLAKKVELQEDEIKNGIGQLPNHLIQADSKQQTVALSEMMGKLDESDKGLKFSKRKLFLAILIIGISYAVYYFKWYELLF